AAPERVRLQRRALTLRVVREVERAVGNRLAVVPADAVRPDLVEVLSRKCLSGIETAEQRLPVRVRAARVVRRATAGRALLPRERDLLRALVREAADLVVPGARRDVVVRVDQV